MRLHELLRRAREAIRSLAKYQVQEAMDLAELVTCRQALGMPRSAISDQQCEQIVARLLGELEAEVSQVRDPLLIAINTVERLCASAALAGTRDAIHLDDPRVARALVQVGDALGLDPRRVDPAHPAREHLLGLPDRARLTPQSGPVLVLDTAPDPERRWYSLDTIREVTARVMLELELDQ